MIILIPSSKDWAKEQLDLEAAQESDISLLKYIEGEDFLLNDLETEALSILAGEEIETFNSQYHESISQKIHQDIAEFRSVMFSQPIQARREKIKELESLSTNYLSCKAVLAELRLGLFLDINEVPDENRAKKIVVEYFTSVPQKRSEVFDDLSLKSEEEKKDIYKDYLELGKLDSDFLRICSHIEDLLNPKVVIEKPKKKKRAKKSINIWLVLLLIWLVFKLITLSVKRSINEDIKNRPKTDPKVEEKQKSEKDEFLEFLEKEEGVEAEGKADE